MLATLHKDQESTDRMYKIWKEMCPDKDLSFMIPEDDVLEGGFVPRYQEMCFRELVNIKFEDEYPHRTELNRLLNEEGNLQRILEEHPELDKADYGVADNFEQIKEYYKEEIEDPDSYYAIKVDRVDQDKSNEGNEDGWRWHKWGPYIGDLEPECEYLDDEDFGDDWQGYVIIFSIVRIRPEE